MADTAGQMHTGATAPPTGQTAPIAGQESAVPAKRGLFGGRRNREAPVAADVGTRGRSGFGINTGARIGLVISQLVTALAFVIVLGGLSALQKRTNETATGPAQSAIYTEAFQSGGQRPYPGDGRHQFGLQWWVLMFEILIFCMIMVLIAFPRNLLRLKHTAMAFLVYVFVLTTLQIDSLLWFERGSVQVSTAQGVTSIPARTIFGTSRLRATIAGSIIGAVANAFSIIFLGLLRKSHPNVGIGGKRVGADVPGHHHHDPAVANAV